MKQGKKYNLKVLIAGATGFTGRYIVNQLLTQAEKYCISIFVRDSEKAHKLGLNNDEIHIFTGDFEHSNRLQDALAGQDVFICAASLGFGHAPSLINACKSAGVRRTIFISTTSVFTSLNSKSKKIRIEAESVIKESGLDWTIIRPTMIFGAPGDRNMERLIHYIRRWPVIVVPGPGTFLMQPIYVKDLAKAILLSVESDITIGREYSISGRDAFTYNRILKIIAESLHKRIAVVHLPLKLMIRVFGLYASVSRKPRITVEQLLRLNEDKAFSYDAAAKDFGYDPTPFETVIMSEINECMKSCEQ